MSWRRAGCRPTNTGRRLSRASKRLRTSYSFARTFSPHAITGYDGRACLLSADQAFASSSRLGLYTSS